VDDGPDPGDDELIAEWNWWGFSPQSVGLAICGLGVIVTALVWKIVGYRWLAIAVTLCAALLAYDAQMHRRLVPAEGLTLEAFFDWQPNSDSAVVRDSAGSEHLIVFGPFAGVLPSDRSAYVFDKSGKLVDWESDIGESVRFKRHWRPFGQRTKIDRQSAREWMAKP